MAKNKTPLYQSSNPAEVSDILKRDFTGDYTFQGGKHPGSTLSRSESGDLTFTKDGDIIRLDPNSSSAKFLLKQQKHEQHKSDAQEIITRSKHHRERGEDFYGNKLVKNIDNSGEEEEFFHEPDSRVVKGPDTF